MEAAEKRRQEAENRGIKNPEKVRQMQERAAKLEQEELEAAKRGMGNPALRVSDKFHFSSLSISNNYIIYTCIFFI